MKADMEHFHHLLLGAGFSVPAAFMAFAFINLLLVACGVGLDLLGVPDFVSLSVLVLTGIGLVRLMYRAHKLVRWLPAISRGTVSDATHDWSR
jgi:hypothetical protein